MSSGFSIDTYNLPFLRNYEAAQRHHDSIKPLRGSDFRPLGRNRKNKTVWIKQDPTTGDIIAGYHRTGVVRYCKDERTIIIDCAGFHTKSTADFINNVSPISAVREHNRIWISGFTSKDVEREEDSRELYRALSRSFPLTAPTTLHKHKDHGRWIIENPSYPVVHSVSRKGASRLRSNYLDFRRYLSALVKLRKGEDSVSLCADTDTSRELFGERTWVGQNGTVNRYTNWPQYLHWMGSDEVREKFLPLCLDPETFHKAAMWLNRSGGLLQTFDRVLMQTSPEVYFEERVVTDGSVVKDPYRKYFPG